MQFSATYISCVKFEFHRYKDYGDTVFKQLSNKALFWRPSQHDNSIAIIVKHLAGNMLSRWSNILSEDGEKEWRDRDNEFEDPPESTAAPLQIWEEGWNCLFLALDSVDKTNFNATVKIRAQAHTITEAINRQLAHYAFHVGQLVFIGKMVKKNIGYFPLSQREGLKTSTKKCL